jgi:hypothetical protein
MRRAYIMLCVGRILCYASDVHYAVRRTYIMLCVGRTLWYADNVL